MKLFWTKIYYKVKIEGNFTADENEITMNEEIFIKKIILNYFFMGNVESKKQPISIRLIKCQIEDFSKKNFWPNLPKNWVNNPPNIAHQFWSENIGKNK